MEEINLINENFKELLYFLIKEERKYNYLQITQIKNGNYVQNSVEIYHPNWSDDCRFDWFKATTQGVYWYPNYYTMKEFKIEFKKKLKELL